MKIKSFFVFFQAAIYGVGCISKEKTSLVPFSFACSVSGFPFFVLPFYLFIYFYLFISM